MLTILVNNYNISIELISHIITLGKCVVTSRNKW